MRTVLDKLLFDFLICLALPAFAAGRFGGAILQWLRQRSSEAWRWAKTNIEDGSVTVIPGGRSGSVYRVSVGYSYAVNGEKHGGAYSEDFRRQSDAEHPDET